nr:GNAT family protein [Jannaschia sp. LMIT008]
MAGARVRLERLRPGHAAALHAANAADDAMWDRLPYGPFADGAAYADWVAGSAAQTDPAFYAMRSGAGWCGVGALMRIDRAHGSIEIGHLAFAPTLRRTPAATEALFLMADRAFDAGFRRLEWKCDAANAASRRAAERLGFTAEGTFRQHMVVKGRSRDTAWFSILDREWPDRRAALVTWLAPANFDADGRQIRSLGAIRAAGVR